MNAKILKIVLLLAVLAMPAGIAAQETQYIYHTVTKGQGLYSISRMYGVTEEDIISANPGSDKVIRIGDELRIPRREKPAQGGSFHTVQAGETLYSLARANNTTVQAICDANPGLEVATFKAGQVIIIPGVSETDAPAKTNDNIAVVPTVQDDIQPVDNAQVSASTYRFSQRTHVVQRFETVFRICKNYGITQTQFLEANPQYKYAKLKKGDTVIIPYPDGLQPAEAPSGTKTDWLSAGAAQTEPEQDIEETVTEPVAEPVGHLRKAPHDVIMAAMIMPFRLGSKSDADQKKMVEFYQGTLLAIDKLKKEGVSVDLHVYDSGPEGTSIDDILHLSEMADMDIIFGPRYDNQIAEASVFARNYMIPLVLPVNSNVDEVYVNPYIYQVNTPQSYLMSEVYDHFLHTFSKPHVIILDKHDGTQNAFLSGFVTFMQEHGIPYETVSAETDAKTLAPMLRPECQNIFILSSASSSALMSTLPILQIVTHEKEEGTETHLFGYPEYQAYAVDYLEQFYDLDTWFYSWFYSNDLLPEAVEFKDKFHRSFSRQLLGTYPNFAEYGYDMAYYFLKGLHQYGNDLSENLSNIRTQPVQMGFKFERASNWGGFINRKVFFVHLSNEFNAEKIEFE